MLWKFPIHIPMRDQFEINTEPWKLILKWMGLLIASDAPAEQTISYFRFPAFLPPNNVIYLTHPPAPMASRIISYVPAGCELIASDPIPIETSISAFRHPLPTQLKFSSTPRDDREKESHGCAWNGYILLHLDADFVGRRWEKFAAKT